MKVCDVPGCGKPASSARAPWCEMHRGRMRTHGTLDALRPKSYNGAPCTVEGCEKSIRGKGYCLTHYTRWRKHGDPLYVMSVEEKYGTAEQRFWRKVNKQAAGGCWEWTGARSSGYGTFNLGNNTYSYAHRVAYEWLVRPIPEGLTLDHLCRNPPCCNPAHLEPVDMAENTRRASRIGHFNAPTSCHRGHDWSVTPPYLARRSNGQVTRRCRVCANERERARRIGEAS